MTGVRYLFAPAKKCGRSYPDFYDHVDRPKGYVISNFNPSRAKVQEV
jgi:hypothetical protein